MRLRMLSSGAGLVVVLAGLPHGASADSSSLSRQRAGSRGSVRCLVSIGGMPDVSTVASDLAASLPRSLAKITSAAETDVIIGAAYPRGASILDISIEVQDVADASSAALARELFAAVEDGKLSEALVADGLDLKAAFRSRPQLYSADGLPEVLPAADQVDTVLLVAILVPMLVLLPALVFTILHFQLIERFTIWYENRYEDHEFDETLFGVRRQADGGNEYEHEDGRDGKFEEASEFGPQAGLGLGSLFPKRSSPFATPRPDEDAAAPAAGAAMSGGNHGGARVPLPEKLAGPGGRGRSAGGQRAPADLGPYAPSDATTFADDGLGLGSLFPTQTPSRNVSGGGGQAKPTTQFSSRGRRGAAGAAEAGNGKEPAPPNDLAWAGNNNGPGSASRPAQASSMSSSGSPPSDKGRESSYGAASSNLSAAPTRDRTPREPAMTARRAGDDMAGVAEGNEGVPSTTYGPVQTMVGHDANSSGVAHGQLRMASMENMDSEELLMAFSALQGDKTGKHAAGGGGSGNPPPEFWYVGQGDDPLGLAGTPGPGSGAHGNFFPSNRPSSSAVSAVGSTRSKASKRSTMGPGYLGASKEVNGNSPDRRRILDLHKEVLALCLLLFACGDHCCQCCVRRAPARLPEDRT